MRKGTISDNVAESVDKSKRIRQLKRITLKNCTDRKDAQTGNPGESNSKIMQTNIVKILENVCRENRLPLSRVRKAAKSLLEEQFDDEDFKKSICRSSPHHKCPAAERAAVIPLWSERGGVDRSLECYEFIQKYYKQEIEQEIITQAYIRQCDFSLYQAFHNWKHRAQLSCEAIQAVIGFHFPARSRDRKLDDLYGEEGQALLQERRAIDSALGKVLRRHQKPGSLSAAPQ